VSESSAAARDVAVSIRNALVVGSSLVVTWSLALLVRLWLPRKLGPELFGDYSFAEALAINGFGFISLGIDTYIQKEVPSRPEHASDFFGGTMLLRFAASAIVFGVIAGIAARGGYSHDALVAALLFGAAQLASLVGGTCATMLYAARRVGRLSALNVATKVLWAVGVVAGMISGAGLWAYAAAALASEAVRALMLFVIAKSELDLRMRVDVRQTLDVVKKSLPFYVNVVAMALYGKIDVAIMGMSVPEREIGWYGAATNISVVAMMVAPLFNWVLMPQLSRAASRGRDSLFAMVRRTFDLTLIFGAGIATVLGACADVVVHVVFGSRFEPSIGALRALSPLFLFVYLAMLGATCLILLERSWTATLVMVASFVVNASANLLVLRFALARLGDGGAGIGAAAVSASTEGIVAFTMFWFVGKEAFDRRNASTAIRVVACAALTVAVDRLAAPIGSPRIFVDALAYVVLIVATRALDVREAARVLSDALKRRRGEHAGS